MRKISLIVTACVILAACGGSSDAGTNPIAASIAGAYSLSTVNGAPLPFTNFISPSTKQEITADVITINDTGSWTELISLRNTVNGVVSPSSVTDAGSYSRSGTAITLSSPTTGALSGAVANGTLTLSESGLALIYVRH